MSIYPIYLLACIWILNVYSVFHTYTFPDTLAQRPGMLVDSVCLRLGGLLNLGEYFGESTARAFICRAVLHLYILKYCEPYRWHASLRIQHVSPTYIYKYIHITSLYVHVDHLLLDLCLFTCLLAHRLWTCIVCFARTIFLKV